MSTTQPERIVLALAAFALLLQSPLYAQESGWEGTLTQEQVQTLWNAEDFAELEALAGRLRQEKARYPSGEWQLPFFYVSLTAGTDTMTADQEQAHVARITRWRQAFPDSVTPLVVLGQSQVDWAWRERGGGYAGTVTDAGWRGFRRYLSDAAESLGEARSLGGAATNAYHPEIYPPLITTQMGLGDEEVPTSFGGVASTIRDSIAGIQNVRDTGLQRLFEEGQSVEPKYPPLYAARADSLLPRWDGLPGEVEAFAEQSAERAGDEFYARIAARVLEYVGLEAYRSEHDFEWPAIRRGHEDVLAAFPDSTYRRSVYALLASVHGDKKTAAEQFNRLGEYVDAYVWRQNEFPRWRAWINGEKAHPYHHQLETAMEYDDLDNLRLLLDTGLDPNHTNYIGESLLYRAAVDGDVALARMLLAYDAESSFIGENGQAPIHGAARAESDLMLRLLLDEGVDPNTRGAKQETPLQMAIHWGKGEYTETLLEAGAEPGLADVDGATPLHEAAEHNILPAAQALVAAGAPVDVKNNLGVSPLVAAAAHASTPFVALLLNEGADVNSQSGDGWTALHHAANRGDVTLVRLLLEHGAEMNVQQNETWTPLMIAVKRNAIPVARELLESGADTSIRLDTGQSALNLAVLDDLDEMADLIRAYRDQE